MQHNPPIGAWDWQDLYFCYLHLGPLGGAMTVFYNMSYFNMPKQNFDLSVCICL